MILAGEFPETWDEFRGQDKAKHQLRNAAQAAKKRGRRMPHTLLASPVPGLGKTGLALLTAQEMGSRVKIVSGAMTIDQARMVFMEMNDFDILLWDEIHMCMAGGKAKAEWLLHFLDNGVLLTPLGAEPQPQVTVIGTTTDIGVIPEPIKDRLRLQPVLLAYTDVEAAQVAAMMSAKVLLPEGLPLVDAPTAIALARAASNRPRQIRKLLEQLRDLALTGDIQTPTDGSYDLTLVLDFAGLTPDGLTAKAITYLHVMYIENKGRAVGRLHMIERLGEVGRGLVPTEDLLVNKGLIAKTKGGRMLTQEGMIRAKELAKDTEENNE